MTDHLESLILKEANRQGIQPNADAMRKAAIELAGAALTSDGLIHLPNIGAIAPADYIRSLRSQTPEAFSDLTHDAPVKSIGYTGLTAKYTAEIAASRAKPIDASKYTGLTRSYIEERNNR